MGVQVRLPKRKLTAFCKRNGISRLALFGSALRTDFTSESDLDLLVEFHPNLQVTLLDMERLQSELSSLLGRQVDLRTPRELSRHFREKVLAGAVDQYAE